MGHMKVVLKCKFTKLSAYIKQTHKTREISHKQLTSIPEDSRTKRRNNTPKEQTERNSGLKSIK